MADPRLVYEDEYVAGSASTLLAAREIGRRAEGCEISAEYCAAAFDTGGRMTNTIAQQDAEQTEQASRRTAHKERTL